MIRSINAAESSRQKNKQKKDVIEGDTAEMSVHPRM